MSTAAATVFLVDDDTSFLAGLARLLRASGLLVKAFSSATDFLAQLPPDASGCVVADLRMPGLNGIDLQQALANMDNPLPIIFLTGHGDIPSSVTAMRRGAEDFLTKRVPKAQLLAAVQRALVRDTRERRQRSHRRELGTRFDRLTPRDQEVLTHVLRGQSNKQIAADLGIAERSVKRHRTSLMTKLQVESVAELSHLAHEAGKMETNWMIPAVASQPPRPRP
jgi:RNA polymerase sigma factor (sigma-70 family)